MNVNLPRLGALAAATALVLTACGSGDSSVDTADSVDRADGGLRAPTPIEASDAGSAANGSATTAESTTDASASDASSDMAIAPAFIVSDFVVGSDLQLPDDTTGYVFDAGVEATADQAAGIAAAFGVDGEPERIDDGSAVRWRIGPDDGSAPSFELWNDAMLSWSYNSGWDDGEVVGCSSAASAPAIDPAVDPAVDVTEPAAGADAGEPGEPDSESTETPDTRVVEPDEECVTPEPPTGVPSADQAEQLTTEYLDALGVDAGSVTFDTFADEWSANVTATQMFDGAVPMTWGFTFGAEAELDYAWGSAAEPDRVGPYELIDLDTAIERLRSNAYGYGPFAGRGDMAIAEDATEVAPAPTADTAAPNSVAPDVPTETMAPSDELPVDLPEGEIDPAGEIPPSEQVTVTLVDVEADLWWVWDVHGSAWLVPAYRFIGDDDGWYTVPAVTDDFLVQVEPPAPEPLPEPIPVEPDGGIGDGADPLPDPGALLPLSPEMYAAGAPLVADHVGLPLDEFERAVTTDGYGPVRVVGRDGEALDHTDDLVMGRVDVVVATRDDVEYVVDAAVETDPAAPNTTAPPATIDPGYNELVGLPLGEYTTALEDQGLVVRVVQIDGEQLVVTDDFVENRVNVAVETRDGVEYVVAAYLDGEPRPLDPVTE